VGGQPLTRRGVARIAALRVAELARDLREHAGLRRGIPLVRAGGDADAAGQLAREAAAFMIVESRSAAPSTSRPVASS
jgi:hypothetical protein